MLRSVGSKVAWVGRTASMVFGLALVLGVASMALGANGDFFKVGRSNVASSVSTLTKSGAGPALSLKVGRGAPLAVNSQARVANLNADRLDGSDSGAFAASSQFDATQVIRDEGPLPLSGTFTSHGGTLVVIATGSGYRSSTNAQFQGNIGMWVYFTDSSGSGPGHRMGVHTNEQNSHKTFVSEPWVINDLPAGTYTVTLEAADEVSCKSGFETDESYCTTTDQNDPFYVTVVELPE